MKIEQVANTIIENNKLIFSLDIELEDATKSTRAITVLLTDYINKTGGIKKHTYQITEFGETWLELEDPKGLLKYAFNQLEIKPVVGTISLSL